MLCSLVGSGNIDKAAIFNVEGTSVWASTTGFAVSLPTLYRQRKNQGFHDICADICASTTIEDAMRHQGRKINKVRR